MTKINDACEWKEDDDGVYETGCGYVYIFNDGSPAENEFLYCPFCGKKLIVKLPTRGGSHAI